MVILNDSTPLCKTRVLYIGSAVPLETAEGLDAIQGPLRERYPVNNESSLEGIDAILSISNACIQLQYVNDSDQVIQFPISSLTLCAAVRCVNTTNGATGEQVPKFVSLQDPLAGGDNSKRPAIFTAITRRTQGRKVLECHGFVCSSSRDALNLVKCGKIAGMNFKKNGSVAAATPRAKQVVTPTPSNSDQSTANRLSTNSDWTKISTKSKSSVPNGTVPVQNGTGTAMRLVPAEPVAQQIAAGPEFFEPVSTQGYFYSSNTAEVKKYNITMMAGEKRETPVTPTNGFTVDDTASLAGSNTPTQMNGHGPSPTPRPPPSRMTAASAPPTQPVYVRYHAPRGQMGPRPMFYGPPPPPPPMMMRPRFFSPPPPMMRPYPYPVPPGGPMPMYAPPIYIRRPRQTSAGSSRSKSNSSDRSRGSRTPTREANGINGDTAVPTVENRRIPNADDSSDDSIHRRPSTPPTDYDNKGKKKGERMSRRDTYEVRYGRQPSPVRMMGPPPEAMPPFPYDYYVYPPRHGGYAPFTMYNPHGRSRSLPPNDRRRSKSPRKKGKKKQKKNKKSRKNKERPGYNYQPAPNHYTRYPIYQPEHSDLSNDSFGGYHSEIPRKTNNDALNGYTFYPPRDFRRNENQFMNERHFSQSIARETRRSQSSRTQPTAYELNDEYDKNLRGSTKIENTNEDADFKLY